MDALTANQIAMLVVILVMSPTLLILRKKREKDQFIPIDIEHYFDPKSNKVVRIHRPK